MGFKAWALALSFLLGCTPAQRRAAGGAVAGLGLATSSVGALMLGPCQLEPRAGRAYSRSNDRSCRERTTSRFADQGSHVLVTGVSVMALGGLLYLSGSQLRRPRPRSKPPSAAADNYSRDLSRW
jgi:hypothetical protein